MQYGPLPQDDSAFRALCLLLASQQPYSRLPLKRVQEFLPIIQYRHNYCAFDGSTLRGAILWHEIMDTAAEQCIEEGRMPKPRECVKVGEAVATLCFIAPSPGLVRTMWDGFMATQAGRLVLYERHVAGKPPRFMWLDRTGKRRGKSVD